MLFYEKSSTYYLKYILFYEKFLVYYLKESLFCNYISGNKLFFIFLIVENFYKDIFL